MLKKLARRPVLLGVLSFFVLAVSAGVLQLFVNVTSSDRLIDGAWQQAKASGSYAFHTDVVQTTNPAPKPGNMGLGSTQEQLILEGSTDLAAQTVAMRLWKGSQTTQPAIEIQVADGKARGRAPGGEWTDISNIGSLVAPDNDPLTYLVAARDVQRDVEADKLDPSVHHFVFTLDGRAYGEHLRQRLESQMRSEGKLPVGARLDTLARFAGMSGTGRMTVGEDGLPRQLKLNVSFPPSASDQVDAEIVTSFRDWGKGRVRSV